MPLLWALVAVVLNVARVGGAALAAQAVVVAPVDLPDVRGRLSASDQSYPFNASMHSVVPMDLGEQGYVEEEFLLTGRARIYGKRPVSTA